MGARAAVPSPQLPWSADEEKKRQCVFKGKDPQVSPAAGGCLGAATGAGSALCQGMGRWEG